MRCPEDIEPLHERIVELAAHSGKREHTLLKAIGFAPCLGQVASISAFIDIVCQGRRMGTVDEGFCLSHGLTALLCLFEKSLVPT